MSTRPLLIYDGECGFCQYCVDYARAATGTAVDYRPFQQVGEQFPDISEQQFRASIQLIKPDGEVSSGAHAAFETLQLGGSTGLWHWCYTTLPLFAGLCEWGYRRVAKSRGACYAVCRALFGAKLQPASVSSLTWLFLRLLALVYLAAFVSFTLQIPGLIGEQGILPAERYFEQAASGFGGLRFWALPSLLWLDTSTTTIQAIGWAGVACSLLLLFDIRSRICLPILYLLYLSLYHGAQVFMAFQWDILLLECGFLAIFLPWWPRLFTWLYRWLLFRFMLQAGLVKLISGDPAWQSMTALQYHFETQPLPSALAWYAHTLPAAVLQAGVVFTFIVELFVPFLMLMPRRPRMLAATVTALFQLMIFATGSYNFFNLLTLCLCLLLLDDQALARLLPTGLMRTANRRQKKEGAGGYAIIASAVTVIYLTQSSILLAYTGNRQALPDTLRLGLTPTAPFHIANGYGVFAIMTTRRYEVIFEGSRDGRNWLPYELPYNPGAIQRCPQWATPHQPRLDWQLWFAALAPREHNPWLGGLVSGLLRGSPPVLDLFKHNPFTDAPPGYVRASLYQYRFSNPETRQRTGQCWNRVYARSFWPVTAWRGELERINPG